MTGVQRPQKTSSDTAACAVNVAGDRCLGSGHVSLGGGGGAGQR